MAQKKDNPITWRKASPSSYGYKKMNKKYRGRGKGNGIFRQNQDLGSIKTMLGKQEAV
jgi:hypothetical protein